MAADEVAQQSPSKHMESAVHAPSDKAKVEREASEGGGGREGMRTGGCLPLFSATGMSPSLWGTGDNIQTSCYKAGSTGYCALKAAASSRKARRFFS